MKLIKHAEGVYEIQQFLDEEQIAVPLFEAEQDSGWSTSHVGNTRKKMSNELYSKMEQVYKLLNGCLLMWNQ